MNQNFELNLQAWVDGELSESEARALSAQITQDATAQQLAAELRGIKSALAGNEVAVTLPETREFYWSKIARQIEREERASQPAPAPARRVAGWRHWLSPVVGLSGLACMLILAIHPNGSQNFDEISATGEGMEAVTFHDQSAGMTVVWLSDAEQTELAAPAAAATPVSDTRDSEVEME